MLQQLIRERDVQAKMHREVLLRMLRSIRYLTRQGRALRGHREDSESMEGNLYQLLLLQAVEFPAFAQWLQKREYISPEITNEIIVLMGQTVLCGLLADIHSRQWFSIISDETTDINHNQQICIAIRWVDQDYDIRT